MRYTNQVVRHLPKRDGDVLSASMTFQRPTTRRSLVSLLLPALHFVRERICICDLHSRLLPRFGPNLDGMLMHARAPAHVPRCLHICPTSPGPLALVIEEHEIHGRRARSRPSSCQRHHQSRSSVSLTNLFSWRDLRSSSSAFSALVICEYRSLQRGVDQSG